MLSFATHLADLGGAGAAVRRARPPAFTRIINSKACRGAVMFGDVLSIDECASLLRKLSKCDFPFQCAHGRPSMIPLIQLGGSGDGGGDSDGARSSVSAVSGALMGVSLVPPDADAGATDATVSRSEHECVGGGGDGMQWLSQGLGGGAVQPPRGAPQCSHCDAVTSGDSGTPHTRD